MAVSSLAYCENAYFEFAPPALSRAFVFALQRSRRPPGIGAQLATPSLQPNPPTATGLRYLPRS